MNEYPKIQTVFKRDPATNHRTLLDGVFSLVEFEYLQDAEWAWTEKIDGTNIRVSLAGGHVDFGGRTDSSQIPSPLITKLMALFRDGLLSGVFPDGAFTLYGEGYGAKIQKGGGNYIPDGCDFILFDVTVGGMWLKRDDVEDVAEKLGIDVVPMIGAGTLQQAVYWARQDNHSEIGDAMAEGLVMRPAVELQTRRGHRIITKIKHKDFPS